MSESVWWSVPVRPIDVEPAKRRIRQQHDQILALLRRARVTAEAALRGSAERREAVASAIGDVRTTVESHLSFEEKVMVPLFEADVLLGPERVRHLLEAHARQRLMLAALHDEAVRCPCMATLPSKLLSLTAWLLFDMTEEERDLFTADVSATTRSPSTSAPEEAVSS